MSLGQGLESAVLTGFSVTLTQLICRSQLAQSAFYFSIFKLLNWFYFHSNKVTKTSGLRPMEPRDVKAIRELANSYLKQFHLAPVMDEEEVAHWFLPQEHIIDTFVVEVKIR